MKLDTLHLIEAKALARDIDWLRAELHKHTDLQPTISEHVKAHIRCAYGYLSIKSFVDCAIKSDVIDCAKDCLTAITASDFSALKGQPEPQPPVEAFTGSIDGQPASAAEVFAKAVELSMKPGNSITVNYQIIINQNKE